MLSSRPLLLNNYFYTLQFKIITHSWVNLEALGLLLLERRGLHKKTFMSIGSHPSVNILISLVATPSTKPRESL